MVKITEFKHQCNVIKWSQQPSIREKYPDLKLLHHIPNGGSRNEIEAKNLQRSGVKSGVPDLCLPVPRGRYHGLYIEMKTETGKVDPNQDWWQNQLALQGYFSIVCYGWESAVRVLEWYLNLREYGDCYDV